MADVGISVYRGLGLTAPVRNVDLTQWVSLVVEACANSFGVRYGAGRTEMMFL